MTLVTQNTHEWVSALIGKPWRSGARGPDAFDCWGLLAWVYLQQRGIVLNPLPDLDPKDLGQVAKAARLESVNWQQVLWPQHLAAVAMSTGVRIHHVGVWLDIDGGLVLHTTENSSVVAQTLVSLRNSGITTIKYYVP